MADKNISGIVLPGSEDIYKFSIPDTVFYKENSEILDSVALNADTLEGRDTNNLLQHFKDNTTAADVGAATISDIGNFTIDSGDGQILFQSMVDGAASGISVTVPDDGFVQAYVTDGSKNKPMICVLTYGPQTTYAPSVAFAFQPGVATTYSSDIVRVRRGTAINGFMNSGGEKTIYFYPKKEEIANV